MQFMNNVRRRQIADKSSPFGRRWVRVYKYVDADGRIHWMDKDFHLDQLEKVAKARRAKWEVK